MLSIFSAGIRCDPALADARCPSHDARSSHDDIMGLKLEPTLQIAPLSPGNCYEASQLL